MAKFVFGQSVQERIQRGVLRTREKRASNESVHIGALSNRWGGRGQTKTQEGRWLTAKRWQAQDREGRTMLHSSQRHFHQSQQKRHQVKKTDGQTGTWIHPGREILSGKRGQTIEEEMSS